VYGRDIAGTDYHLYSTALRQKRGRWDRAALDTFLQNPDAFASGTTMEYGPIRDDRIRAGVLLYLESLQ
jgi:cytochrome c